VNTVVGENLLWRSVQKNEMKQKTCRAQCLWTLGFVFLFTACDSSGGCALGAVECWMKVKVKLSLRLTN
jgi:hypothetical protein